MAVTSIWPIKNGVRDVIVYACNPEKTTEENRTALHSVANVIEYAADELKTERCEYVTGINCRQDNAISVFNETRKRWGKEKDKRVCYHAYQSFRENELNADTAHKIGVELAERLWGDRFEVIVATHCNTGCYHNHFVLNAVSFVDGKKYCNYKSDYEALRNMSDTICKEYQLSVLENTPIHTAGNKNEVWVHKAGKLTHRDMLKRDIEYCLKYSSKPQEFQQQLYGLGYTIDWRRMSIKSKDWERAIRLKSIGFPNEIIAEYFNKNHSKPYFYRDEWNRHTPYKHQYTPVTKMMKELNFSVKNSESTGEILVCAVLYIILALFELMKSAKKYAVQSVELRHEAQNIEKYITEYNFMKSKNLETLEDISRYINRTKDEITQLEQERNIADNKRRRAEPEDRQKYKDERKALTERITPLRKNLKQAEKIYDESPRLFDLVKKEYQLERKILERNFYR